MVVVKEPKCLFLTLSSAVQDSRMYGPDGGQCQSCKERRGMSCFGEA